MAQTMVVLHHDEYIRAARTGALEAPFIAGMQGFVGVGSGDRVRTTSGNRAASDRAVDDCYLYYPGTRAQRPRDTIGP